MIDLLERARILGIGVQIRSGRFTVNYPLQKDQSAQFYFENIESLEAFVDGFALAHAVGKKRMEKALKEVEETLKAETEAEAEDA